MRVVISHHCFPISYDLRSTVYRSRVEQYIINRGDSLNAGDRKYHKSWKAEEFHNV